MSWEGGAFQGIKNCCEGKKSCVDVTEEFLF